MRTEEWRPVVGYEGLYEVSDLGRVRGVSRTRCDGHLHIGVVLRGSPSEGYRKYKLYKDGEYQFIGGHRIVLEAFSGLAPEGTEACHNDGSRDNNVSANLRWDTKSNNAKDKVRHGRLNLKRVVGEATTGAKISEEDVRRIREARLFGAKAQDLADIYDLCRTHINRIVWRQSWTHI